MSKKLQFWLLAVGALVIIGIILWLTGLKPKTAPPGRELTVEERDKLLESLKTRAGTSAPGQELTPVERNAALRALQETAPTPGRELTPQEREQILQSLINR